MTTARALRLLGAFQVERDGVTVTQFHSDKVRALLAYLAAESDRPHARSALAALLWPEQADAAALSDVEAEHIRRVLRQTGGIIEGARGAARILGLKPSTLRFRMKRLGIERSRRG